MRSFLLSLFFLILTFTSPLVSGRGKVDFIQSIERFNTPSSCVFSLDGKSLFVANGSRGRDGWSLNKGAISKLSVSDTGNMEITELRFVDSLTGPIGMAILPVDIGNFRKGSVFVAQGGVWAEDRFGNYIKNSKPLKTGVVVFDPEDGHLLGRILMGEGSSIAKLLEHPILSPTGIAFDSEGNLYLSDAGTGGANLEPAIAGKSGVLRIARGALSMLANGSDDSRIDFLKIEDTPLDVTWDHVNKDLLITTAGKRDISKGVILRLPNGDFSGGGKMQSIGKELPSMGSIIVTKKGTILAGQIEGKIVWIRGKGRRSKFRELNFRDEEEFFGPGSLALHGLPNGGSLLVVPEKAGGGVASWRQRIKIFELPKGL